MDGDPTCPKCGGETTLDGWTPTGDGIRLIRVLRCRTCRPVVTIQADPPMLLFQFFPESEDAS